MEALSDRAVVLYPTYLDIDKSCKEGRRVPKHIAVERPNVQEMFDAVTKGLHLKAVIEQKFYSRDCLNPGRLRVDLRGVDQEVINTDVTTKAALLQQCALLCARHADRPRRLEQLKKYEAHMYSGGAVAASKGAGGPGKSSIAVASKASTRNNKKKGKKK